MVPIMCTSTQIHGLDNVNVDADADKDGEGQCRVPAVFFADTQVFASPSLFSVVAGVADIAEEVLVGGDNEVV